MKLFLAALSMLCAPLALADAATQWQSVDSLRAAAEGLARHHFAQPGQVVRVRATLDDRLQLPACGAPLDSRVQNAAGAALTTAISCAAPKAWTVYVVVQVSREAEVLVLNRPLMAGETVTADAVTLRQREIADLGYGFVNDPKKAIGQTARRALAAGAVIGAGDLAAPRLVKRGQPVTLVSRAGAITVRAEGKALNDGAAGEYIAVENLNSRRIVRGKVHSTQEVDIGL